MSSSCQTLIPPSSSYTAWTTDRRRAQTRWWRSGVQHSLPTRTQSCCCPRSMTTQRSSGHSGRRLIFPWLRKKWVTLGSISSALIHTRSKPSAGSSGCSIILSRAGLFNARIGRCRHICIDCYLSRSIIKGLAHSTIRTICSQRTATGATQSSTRCARVPTIAFWSRPGQSVGTTSSRSLYSTRRRQRRRFHLRTAG